jgi:hypothetical protein
VTGSWRPPADVFVEGVRGPGGRRRTFARSAFARRSGQRVGGRFGAPAPPTARRTVRLRSSGLQWPLIGGACAGRVGRRVRIEMNRGMRARRGGQDQYHPEQHRPHGHSVRSGSGALADWAQGSPPSAALPRARPALGAPPADRHRAPAWNAGGDRGSALWKVHAVGTINGHLATAGRGRYFSQLEPSLSEACGVS